VAADGVFAFGNAPFLGALPPMGINPGNPVTGLAATVDGNGYREVAADGRRLRLRRRRLLRLDRLALLEVKVVSSGREPPPPPLCG
jgi:hypothetical protein